jgi:hypothetical protein
MNHPATTPGQTSHCLFGFNLGNHNETLIPPAAPPVRGKHREPQRDPARRPPGPPVRAKHGEPQ